VMGVGLVVLVCMRFGEISEFLRSQTAAVTPSIDTRFEPAAAKSGPDVVTIAGSTEPQEADLTKNLFPGVPAELLARVRDDTPWIRSDEIDAWFGMWSVLANSSEDDLAAASVARPGFVELFQQPRAFRGRLIAVRGSARQATYTQAAHNEHGVKGYYRVIVWPEGGPAEPIFVYTLELPAGFPTGEDIRAEIEATGFFFKRMVYPTQREAELRRAPVVMARSLTWLEPARQTAATDNTMIRVALGLTIVGIIGLVAVASWATRARASAKPRATATIGPIDDRTVVDVKESLEKLAENDR
jgi:hypothetical protein